jgi:hypothetical protein
MKTQIEIEDRVRFLLAEALDAQVAEASKRLPRLCRHNRQNPLDTRRQVHGENNPGYNRISVGQGEAVTQTIGLCMLGSDDPEVWGGTICEDDIDAQKCPLFEPILSKQHILTELGHVLQSPQQLREKYPEIYGLVWTLDDARPLEIPWWKRLWFKMLRIRVEPIRDTRGYVGLLPAKEE